MSVIDDFDLPDDGPAGVPATPNPQPNQPSGSGLRKQLEDTLAEKKALTDRLTALEAERRATTLTTAMQAAGLPEAAAARYPADAEATPEKITAWAEAEKAYAQQLVGTAPAADGSPATAGQPAPPAGVPAATQQAMAAVAAAQAGAPATEAGLEGMLARLRDPSVSWPQLQAEMAALGINPP